MQGDGVMRWELRWVCAEVVWACGVGITRNLFKVHVSGPTVPNGQTDSNWHLVRFLGDCGHVEGRALLCGQRALQHRGGGWVSSRHPGTCLKLLMAAGGLGSALQSVGETDVGGLDPQLNRLQMMVKFSEWDSVVLWACLLSSPSSRPLRGHCPHPPVILE